MEDAVPGFQFGSKRKYKIFFPVIKLVTNKYDQDWTTYVTFHLLICLYPIFSFVIQTEILLDGIWTPKLFTDVGYCSGKCTGRIIGRYG